MTKYKFLKSKKSFKLNDVICKLGHKFCKSSDPRRMQIDETTFILPPFVIYHSCNPNSYIDWKTVELKALKSIRADEMIAYHYGTSEDDYSIGAFTCRCGAKHCVKEFRGFKYMNLSDRNKIKSYLSPYLLKKYYS